MGNSSIAVDTELEYDQLGNRLSRTDNTTTPATVTGYEYDVHNFQAAGTYNHRLLSATTSQGTTDLTETTYTYNGAGQATRIVDETLTGTNAGDRDVRCLQYDNDQRLWTVIRSACGPSAGTPNREFAREFRYDQDGRQRYLVRDRSPSNLNPLETGQYREYFGNRIHADLAVTVGTTATAAPVRRYAFGYGLIGWQEPVSGVWHIAHADLLGSTRLITDGGGNIAGYITYSAFGETLDSDFDTADARTRYGFCGSWGYETDEHEDPAGNVGLIHVGQRYYDPRIGRFIQRDLTGVAGGLVCYAYAKNTPTAFLDPEGFDPLYAEVLLIVEEMKVWREVYMKGQVLKNAVMQIRAAAELAKLEHIRQLLMSCIPGKF